MRVRGSSSEGRLHEHPARRLRAQALRRRRTRDGDGRARARERERGKMRGAVRVDGGVCRVSGGCCNGNARCEMRGPARGGVRKQQPGASRGRALRSRRADWERVARRAIGIKFKVGCAFHLFSPTRRFLAKRNAPENATLAGATVTCREPCAAPPTLHRPSRRCTPVAACSEPIRARLCCARPFAPCRVLLSSVAIARAHEDGATHIPAAHGRSQKKNSRPSSTSPASQAATTRAPEHPNISTAHTLHPLQLPACLPP